MLSAFALETWATFAVAVPVMLVRFVARLYAPGWRHFDGTDLWCAISTVNPPHDQFGARDDKADTVLIGSLHNRHIVQLFDKHS